MENSVCFRLVMITTIDSFLNFPYMMLLNNKHLS